MALNLSLQSEPSGTIIVTADQHKLAQVVRNLVSNGLKFTPRGGTVNVSVRCESDAATSKDWLVLDVKDSGAGLTVVRVYIDIIDCKPNLCVIGSTG